MGNFARAHPAIAAGIFAAALAAPSAGAQNLLSNPSFAEVLGLTHWTTDSGVAAWDALQCPGFGALGSGSARLDYDTSGVGNPASRVSQCLEVEPGSYYELSGSIFLPESNVGAESALVLRFVAGTCESWTSLSYIGAIASTSTGDCHDRTMIALAPADADAVVAELELIRTTSSTNVTAYFDDISLRNLPEPAALAPWASLAALAALRRRVQRGGTRASWKARNAARTPAGSSVCG